MNRRYRQTAAWETPKPWEVSRSSRGPEVEFTERDFAGKVVGIIFIALLLYAILVVIGLVVLSVQDSLTKDTIAVLLAGLCLPIWSPATYLVFREIYNAGRVNVIVTPAEPAEVIRFIRLSTDELVDPRDLAFFLNRIEVTGNAGQKSIRGLVFPSGRRGSDSYHIELTQALIDAGLWEESPRARTGGRLQVPPKQALEILGLEELT